MFFLFPPVELDDGKTTISLFDTRSSDDDRTTNVDFINVTTTNDDGEELTTHFGTQFRSDHLAEATSKKRSKRNRKRNKQRKAADAE